MQNGGRCCHRPPLARMRPPPLGRRRVRVVPARAFRPPSVPSGFPPGEPGKFPMRVPIEAKLRWVPRSVSIRANPDGRLRPELRSKWCFDRFRRSPDKANLVEIPIGIPSKRTLTGSLSRFLRPKAPVPLEDRSGKWVRHWPESRCLALLPFDPPADPLRCFVLADYRSWAVAMAWSFPNFRTCVRPVGRSRPRTKLCHSFSSRA